MLAPHTTLAGGNYIIQRHLDSGAMADVYLAKDTRRMVNVALKVLRPDQALDSYYEKFLRREATVLQKLQHPNIVRYYDVVREKQLLYLVIEYIVGPTLQQFLFRRKLLPMADAFYVATALATALDYAHRNQIIHRDLKPSNVLLADNGKVLLADFGVARDTSSTTATRMVGTIAYMAPEQINGDTITAATDQYALGIVLWEMLTGRRPFVGATAGLKGTTVSERVIEEHLNNLPPAGVLPAELAEPLMRALAKSPQQRFASCTAMVQAMLPANGIQPTTLPRWLQELRPHISQARPAEPPIAPASVPPAPRARTVPPVQPRISKASIPKLVLMSSLVAAVVLGLMVGLAESAPAQPVQPAYPGTAPIATPPSETTPAP